MKNKFAEILHSTFSIIALLGVIFLSSFVVVNLNPVSLRPEDNLVGPSVAGVSTSQTKLSFINTANESVGYKTGFEIIDDKRFYKAQFNKPQSSVEDNFIKIQNSTSVDGAFLIEAKLPFEVSDYIKITIRDENDTIYLNNLEKRVISLPKNSERNFSIEYKLLVPINFDFEILFEITN